MDKLGKKESKVDGGKLLEIVQKISISVDDARAVAEKYVAHEQRSKEGSSDQARSKAADKIIARYSNLAAAVGGAAGLAGVIPGLGTAVAVTGGALADTAACMKLQVDMCMVLVQLYQCTLTAEDAQHLAFLLAAGAAVERVGGDAAVKIGSKAGVKMLQQYLRGATLQAIKQFFKKLGIVFTRKALEKAIPFGIGVIVGAGFNKALTSYVGKTAKKFLELYSFEDEAA